MNEDENSVNQDDKDGKGAEKIGLDLNFVPEWARKAPETNYFNYEKRDGKREGSRQRPFGRNGDHRSSSRHKQGRRSNTQSHSVSRLRQRPQRQVSERVEIPPVHVRFLPLSRAISAIAKKIQASRRAYPMMQIAFLYIDNPESCSARVEVDKNSQNLHILQCKLCGMIALNEETLYRHMVKMHIDDFMDKVETQGELPSGNFSCVAQCGFSGTLLGPPNHHSYAEKIQEVYSHSYHKMSLENYKSKIVTIHDSEAVERWKQEYSHQVTYSLKDNKTDPPMSLIKAENYFLKNIAPSQLRKTKRATLPVPLCRSIEDRGLMFAIKNAWMKEQRFPISIMTALRGAFGSKGLILFKAGKGKGFTFVTSIPLVPIELEHVVYSIKKVMLHLQSNPGSSRHQLVNALHADAAPSEEQVKEVITPLSWLIERGHIIEFFDGTLSVPSAKKGRSKSAKKDKSFLSR